MMVLVGITLPGLLWAEPKIIFISLWAGPVVLGIISFQARPVVLGIICFQDGHCQGARTGVGVGVGEGVTGGAGFRVLDGINFFRATTYASGLGFGQVLINMD